MESNGGVCSNLGTGVTLSVVAGESIWTGVGLGRKEGVNLGVAGEESEKRWRQKNVMGSRRRR